MDPEKKKRLEAAGFKSGDYGDFLGLTDVERQIVEFRAGLARAVREGREEKGLTQRQLAAAIGSSQSRVAKLESATADTSVDLMLKALFTVGREVPAGLTGASTALEPKSAKSPRREQEVLTDHNATPSYLPRTGPLRPGSSTRLFGGSRGKVAVVLLSVNSLEPRVYLA